MRQVARRRIRQDRARAVELKRVGKVEAHPDSAGSPCIPGPPDRTNRVSGLQQVDTCLSAVERVERDVGRRAHHPALDDRMLLREAFSEEVMVLTFSSGRGSMRVGTNPSPE